MHGRESPQSLSAGAGSCSWGVLPAAFLLLWLPLTGQASDAVEAEYWEGLRARKLYRLAELYGTRQLARTDLTERQQADVAIELAVTITEQARQTPAAERHLAWDRAVAPLTRFLQTHPESPFRLIVETQQALVLLARAELTRLEAEGTAAQQTGYDRALDSSRLALRKLAETRTTVDQQLASRALQPESAAGTMPTPELESLRRHLGYQLGRGYHGQAFCFATDSADQANALQLAHDHLQHLALQASDELLVWQARAELVTVLRQQSRFDEASRYLTQWNEADIPAEMQLRLVAEQVELYLARGDLDAAFAALRAVPPTMRDRRGALNLAHLRALIASRATTGADAQWGARITSLLARMRTYDAPYYVRQAELLAGQAIAQTPGGSQPEALELAAGTLYRAGRPDAAIARYEQASTALFQAGNPDRGFELGITAAAIDQARGNHPSAATRLRRLALAEPSHELAAATHRRAIMSQAAAVRASNEADRTARIVQYREMLQEHLTHWPTHATAHEARVWLGRLLMTSREWLAAANILSLVTDDDPNFDAAQRELIQCYGNSLADSAAHPSDQQQQLLRTATRTLQPLITGAENHWPQDWTRLQLHCAAALADWHLQYGDASSDYARRLLQAASPHASALPDTDPDKLQLAAQSIIALAPADNPSEAWADFARLAQEQPDNGDIQEAYARLLAQTEEAVTLEQALVQWSRVETRSRTGAARWRRARRARIELLSRLGRGDEAEKLRRLTALLYPTR